MRGRSSIPLWIVLAFQISIVLVYAGSKEMTLRFGREVVLATAPVDPRDLVRGDYVTLNYEISRISGCWAGTVGDTLYVPLRPGGDYWVAGTPSRDYAAAMSSGRDDTVVLAGQVASRVGDTCQMVYGIESYYVPEGTGRDVERFRGQLKMRVSIDGTGAPVLKGLIL